jgi:hypothetical protein
MGGLDEPFKRRQGLRVPSTGTSAGRGKGTGAAPTPIGVEWPKVVVQRQGLGNGGAGHHDDNSGGGVGW